MTDQSECIARGDLAPLLEVLDAVRDGNLETRVNADKVPPALQELTTHLNELLTSFDQRSEEFHSRSMELAMGISESFQVLAAVREGDFSVEVSESTLQSEEELISQFGTALNETVVELRTQLETIEQQRYAIRELSTPVLQVWDRVLVMPIVGIVDTARSAEIMERMLSEIVATKSRYVILDITGVEVVDTRTADYIIKVMKGAELLGAVCMLTGIQPAVAQTLVEIGVDLSSIRTLRNLQDALRRAIREMSEEDDRAPIGRVRV